MDVLMYLRKSRAEELHGQVVSLELELRSLGNCDKDLEIPVWETYKQIVAKYDDRGAEAVGNIDRFDFYDEAKDCYCILQTGETAIYANIILQKGVIK